MCLPLVAALGLNAAGNLLNSREESKNVKRGQAALDAKIQAEQERQKAYRAESQDNFNKTLETFNPEAKQNLQTVTQDREQAINQNSAAQTLENVGASLPASSSKIVKSDLAGKMADAVARGRANALNLAKLGATNDLFSGNAINLKQGANAIGTINDFSGKSAALNPAEQKEAYIKSQKAPSGIGDFLSFAGSVIGMNQASGGNMFGKTVNTPIPAGQMGPMPGTFQSGSIAKLFG